LIPVLRHKIFRPGAAPTMADTYNNLVIIGGGHAASQLCASLVEGGWPGRITLVSEEDSLPYHRPPLSKAYLKAPATDAQLLRPESAYTGIEVLLQTRATHIDPAQRTVSLTDGRALPYDAVVLATGARVRRVPGLPGTLDNLHYLRTRDDARRLRTALADAGSVTVLGGGFIGLEIAATAAHLGKPVTVFEMADRLLSRAVSPEISGHVAEVLRQAGVTLQIASGPLQFEQDGRRFTGLVHQGQHHAIDLAVAGIGATPEVALAQAAGLDCDNGIVVDSQMRSSDRRIFALGDCVSFPYLRWGQRLRLESVQNANDQARTLAGVLLGQNTPPYAALPWFWSDLGLLRLQIAGLAPPHTQTQRVHRPGARADSFSVLHFDQGKLVCVESINAPADHIAARKLLEKGQLPGASILADPAVPLKAHC